MNLLTLYTDTHEILYKNYFLKSKIEEYNVIAYKQTQRCKDGSYYQNGWRESMIDKINVIIDYIKQNLNNKEIFVFSDCDVIFLKNTKSLFEQWIGDNDMLFQSDGKNWYCAGFFVAKHNERVLKLFELIAKKFEQNDPESKDDQRLLNAYIRGTDVKYDILPTSVYNYHAASHNPMIWAPGVKFHIPKDCLVFHANWTKGVNHKIKLLDYVLGQTS